MRVVNTAFRLRSCIDYAQVRHYTRGALFQSELVDSELRRRQTAAQLLRVISGRSLEDRERVRLDCWAGSRLCTVCQS